MIRIITRIGNPLALVFNAALRALTGLQAGDAVDVTVRENGDVVIPPKRPTVSAAEAVMATRNLIERNAGIFERLSK